MDEAQLIGEIGIIHAATGTSTTLLVMNVQLQPRVLQL